MQIDGKELLITPASFGEVMALKKAIGDALRADGINIDLGGLKLDEGNPLESEVGGDTIGSLLENVVAIATNPEVQVHLFACCERVVLGDKRDKIDRDFFEAPENRKHYYPIMMEVLKVNLLPFFGNLGSVFSGFQSLITNIQK